MINGSCHECRITAARLLCSPCSPCCRPDPTGPGTSSRAARRLDAHHPQRHRPPARARLPRRRHARRGRRLPPRRRRQAAAAAARRRGGGRRGDRPARRHGHRGHRRVQRPRAAQARAGAAARACAPPSPRSARSSIAHPRTSARMPPNPRSIRPCSRRSPPPSATRNGCGSTTGHRPPRRAVPPAELGPPLVPRRPRPVHGEWGVFRADWIEPRMPTRRRFAPARCPAATTRRSRCAPSPMSGWNVHARLRIDAPGRRGDRAHQPDGRRGRGRLRLRIGARHRRRLARHDRRLHRHAGHGLHRRVAGELVPLLRTLSERYARAAAGGRVDDDDDRAAPRHRGRARDRVRPHRRPARLRVAARPRATTTARARSRRRPSPSARRTSSTAVRASAAAS